jgi:alkanesulfonate monooxygenase SsuD/methylene tetrahydromethanopterin reductase-like flavin-dependent oxidoreductase (luciferase family)
MDFDILSLGDHLPAPGSKVHSDTVAERHCLWIEEGVLGEELGFRGIAFGEHHTSEFIVSSPAILLSAIAVLTKRIKLGTGVSLIPNLDPVRIAEDFATLDQISNGRAEIGVGSGIVESVFKLFGQDPALRNEVSAENLGLLEACWNEIRLDWEGKYRTPIHDAGLQPRTVSGRALPISRGTGTVSTAQEIGRAGHLLIMPTQVGSIGRFREINKAYRDAYRAAGNDPAGMKSGAVAYVYCAEDGAAAREYWGPFGDNYAAMSAREFSRHQMNPNIVKLVSDLTSRRMVDLDGAFVGSPDEIVKKILRWNEQIDGIDRLSCMFDLGGLPREQTLASMKLFAKEVVPAARRELGVLAH